MLVRITMAFVKTGACFLDSIEEGLKMWYHIYALVPLNSLHVCVFMMQVMPRNI